MKQFIKFGVVGISNTIISYLVYVICLSIFRYLGIIQNIDYYVSNFVAFVLSVLWSYYWNNCYTFKKKEGEVRIMWKTLLKTYISYSITGLFLNSLLLYVWINKAGISKNIAPIINLLITVPINFLLNKMWAFKVKK